MRDILREIWRAEREKESDENVCVILVGVTYCHYMRVCVLICIYVCVREREIERKRERERERKK